jgi:hypothetical protein
MQRFRRAAGGAEAEDRKKTGAKSFLGSCEAEAPERTAPEKPLTVAGAPEKLLIVDWDDTVLPTSYLAYEGVLRSPGPAPKPVQAALRKYAARVKETFALLAAHGRVVIVTNAEQGWIDKSCARFLPDLAPLIRALPRISARPFGWDELSEEERMDPSEWKVDAFIALAQMHYVKPAGHTVFSLGDAIFEREAVLRTSERLGVVAQSVKLLENPSLQELEDAHARLQDGSLRKLLSRADGFDVGFENAAPSLKQQAFSVRAGDKACFMFPEIPGGNRLDGFQSWIDLIDAATPSSELDKSNKSAASTSSTLTGITVSSACSVDF